MPPSLRSLRHRNFRLFLSGNLISLVGTWMQFVAESWLVYRLTGSSVLLGLAGFANQIPVFLLGSLGGIAADHYSRHRIVLITQASSMLLAFALATLTLTGLIQIWHVFVLAALLGVVNAFDIPARNVLVVDMVGKEDLMNAIALNSSMFNASRMVGPAIAGMLVARVGEGWCFFINGASYIAVLTGLLLMHFEPHIAPRYTSAGKSIVEGFRYVWHHGVIRAVLTLVAALSLLGLPFSVLLPIFADRILHGGPGAMGLLSSASGAGALLGAILLALRRHTEGLGRLISACAAGFGACLLGFAYSRSLPLSVAFQFGIGFFVMLALGAASTVMQTITEDRFRGRVLAAWGMLFMGMAPVGSLTAGFAAKHFGAPLTVAIGGAACIAAAGFFLTKLPDLREPARALEAQPAAPDA